MSTTEQYLAIVEAERDGESAERCAKGVSEDRPTSFECLDCGFGEACYCASPRIRATCGAASWEALCEHAAGLIAKGPRARIQWSQTEMRQMHGACKPGRSASVVFREISGLALFARLMAIVSRPS